MDRGKSGGRSVLRFWPEELEKQGSGEGSQVDPEFRFGHVLPRCPSAPAQPG